VEAQLSESFSQFSAKREVMRPGRRYFCAFLLFAAAAGFLTVAPAAGHAVLLESTPALKSAVTGPDVPIKLRFNVRIDALRSRLTLIRPDGSSQALEINKQTPADMLVASASGLAAGDYRLRWQVLASDGHITRGEIPFTVIAS
jgi:copper resistance protein C